VDDNGGEKEKKISIRINFCNGRTIDKRSVKERRKKNPDDSE